MLLSVNVAARVLDLESLFGMRYIDRIPLHAYRPAGAIGITKVA
jgi:hypothetical protein